MTSLTIAQNAPRVLILVAEPALRSIVLACLATLVLAALRVRHVTLRLAVWTGVLYGSLAMPLVVWLMPSTPLHLPVPAQHATPLTPASSAKIAGVPLQISRVARTARLSHTASDSAGDSYRQAALGQPRSSAER